MAPSSIPILIASFLLCTLLLWLGSELLVSAEARVAPVGPALTVIGIMLCAIALWWPSHLLRPTVVQAADGDMPWLWPWLPAIALAGLAHACALLWRRGRPGWAVVAGVALPMAAYVHAIFSAPGMFRLPQTTLWLGAGSLTLLLSASLVALHLRLPKRRFGRGLHGAGCLVAAWLVCAGAAFSFATSVGEHNVVATGVTPQWFIVAGFIACGAVLLLIARQPVVSDDQMQPVRVSAIDGLTGLSTRLFFENRLRSAARKVDVTKVAARKGGGASNGAPGLAVVFVDLDGFKPINDSLGHHSGDLVLTAVGQRIREFIDGVGLAARLGGDEFVVLVPAVASREELTRWCDRLIEAVSKPCRIAEREITVSCSVGIALYPQSGSAGKLIARADAAMYSAKRAGGGRSAYFTDDMKVDTQQTFDVLRELRQALVNDELELFFQPMVDARSGKITAAEALIRWNHPTRGLLLPASFIPLAERSGLIGPLGNWVIEAACKQARVWRDKGLRMRVAINLSAHQMRQEDIVDRIAHSLAKHRIRPDLLTCEITESAAMEDTAATQDAFRRLGEMGTHLAIDDFGTGYSSLAYLRQLPAQELKIDASFVRDLEHSADARAVVDAVVGLAHALSLKVVAEGIETPRQYEILVELGCDELQGYLFAKPMTARALLLWALDDRTSALAFRDSLFGETRHTSRTSTRQSTRLRESRLAE